MHMAKPYAKSSAARAQPSFKLQKAYPAKSSMKKWPALGDGATSTRSKKKKATVIFSEGEDSGSEKAQRERASNDTSDEQDIEVEDEEVEENEDTDDGNDDDDKTCNSIIAQMRLHKAGKGHLEAWCTATHFIPKVMGPFVDILMVLQVGIACQSIAEEMWDLDDWPDIDHKKASELMKQFCTLLRIIPGLSKLLPSLDDDPDSLIYLANFLSRKARSARTDDLSNIKRNILKFVPPIKDIPSINVDQPKEQRGFYHYATARLLCPRRMRDQFDEDPGKFCENVLHGNIRIKASDFPSMIYPEKGYNSDAIDENALKSDLLASCFRALFTGPSSGKRPVNAAGSNKKKGSGRNPIAVTYRMKECNKYHVAYVATLARFALNAQREWAESDGDFDNEEYYNHILTLFDDNEWCETTLDWYNGEVFGSSVRRRHIDSVYQQDDGPSSIDLLAQQRAARKSRTQMPLSSQSSDSSIPENVVRDYMEMADGILDQVGPEAAEEVSDQDAEGEDEDAEGEDEDAEEEEEDPKANLVQPRRLRRG